MVQTKRPVFRVDAARRYVEQRVETVAPRVISPPTLPCLGLLAVLLVSGVAVAARTTIPTYVSGSAIVVAASGTSAGEFLVLLPAEAQSRLRPGQPLLIRSSTGVLLKQRPIVAVEPAPVGPDALRERFELNRPGSLPAETAAAVAFAAIDPGEGLSAAAECGVRYFARIEVGSRYAVSQVPVIGRWFPEVGGD
jgi:hypothetical protein